MQGRRLAIIKQELETLEAPTRKDVAEIRARIESTDREFAKVRNMCWGFRLADISYSWVERILPVVTFHFGIGLPRLCHQKEIV